MTILLLLIVIITIIIIIIIIIIIMIIMMMMMIYLECSKKLRITCIMIHGQETGYQLGVKSAL